MIRLTEEQLAAARARVKKPGRVVPNKDAWLTMKLAQSGKELVAAPERPVSAPKPSKYKNKREGAYASQKEAKVANELRLLEKAGEIRNIREQVKFVLIPKQEGERECSYIADFVYDEKRSDGGWLPVVADAKGMLTDVYRLKKKLMRYVHGIIIREL